MVQTMKQETFADIEYSFRKKKTKREEFLVIMDEIIPWDEWVGVIKPYYPTGKRGRPPMGIEKMLRMYLLQIWFNLSDPATEDAIYDSYAVRKFTGIDFMTEAVPDETTLLTAAPAVFPGSVTTRLTGSVILKTANPRCAAK